MAISADGNTAIVGGNSDNGGAGAAWVYSRTGNVWSQQGSKLFGTGAVGQIPREGESVAISGDGNTVIVGGSRDGETGSGVTYSAGAGGAFARASICGFTQ